VPGHARGARQLHGFDVPRTYWDEVAVNFELQRRAMEERDAKQRASRQLGSEHNALAVTGGAIDAPGAAAAVPSASYWQEVRRFFDLRRKALLQQRLSPHIHRSEDATSASTNMHSARVASQRSGGPGSKSRYFDVPPPEPVTFED
jgi:hypothetical protein